MFGYVTVDRDALSEEQKDRFRRVYCGVCRGIEGFSGRLTLTFDAAFLALLLNSLYEPEEKRMQTRCGAHPFKKQDIETSEMTAYAADINAMLFYYSMLDGWSDEKSLPKKLSADAIKKVYDDACERRRDKKLITEMELENLRVLEKQRSNDIDAAAGCFGRLLGGVFAVKNDEWAKLLYTVGDALGRFIYIMDAWDDLDKDKKRGAYNPLIPISEEADFEEKVYSMLRLEMAACADAFEKLPLVKDIDILRNVIYSGVWTKYMSKRQKTESKEGDN